MYCNWHFSCGLCSFWHQLSVAICSIYIYTACFCLFKCHFTKLISLPVFLDVLSAASGNSVHLAVPLIVSSDLKLNSDFAEILARVSTCSERAAQAEFQAKQHSALWLMRKINLGVTVCGIWEKAYKALCQSLRWGWLMIIEILGGVSLL